MTRAYLTDADREVYRPLILELRQRAAESRLEARADMALAALRLSTRIKDALAEQEAQRPRMFPPLAFELPGSLRALLHHNGSPDRAR